MDIYFKNMPYSIKEFQYTKMNKTNINNIKVIFYVYNPAEILAMKDSLIKETSECINKGLEFKDIKNIIFLYLMNGIKSL